MKSVLCSVLVIGSILAATSTAQQLSPVPHDYQPVAWPYWVGVDIPSHITNAHLNGDRILDVQFSNPSATSFDYSGALGVAGTGTQLDVDWEVDHPVSQGGAIVLADLAGMRVAAVDSYYDAAQATTLFISLREALPPGVVWIWIPATTPAAIQAWLLANPSYSPYSVDSVDIGGSREYHVQAWAVDPNATAPLPIIRTRQVVFGTSLSDLKNLASSSGARITDIDQIGDDTFDGILEWPAPGETPHFMDVVDSFGSPNCSPCAIHAGMERIARVSRYQDSSGQAHEFSVIVNNAWSLYDIFNYLLPPPGYRGCAGTLGVPTLSVSSSNPGLASPGSVLTFSASPVFPGATNILILGFGRNQSPDLTGLGAPGCYAIPTFDIFVPFGGSSSIASVNLGLPSSTTFLGLRFYAQVAAQDTAANALGFTTSNAYMITIM